MNQYLAGNHYRRFPFVLDADIPFSDEVLVDLQVVLSTKFDLFALAADGVELIQVDRLAGVATLTFLIVSAELPDYKLVGEVSEAAAEDTRILLALVDSSDVAHPELGYGIAIIGKASDLTTLGGTTVLSAALDRSVIRLNVTNDTLNLRVANANRQGPSSCDETEGAIETITLQGRSADEVPSCVETTTSPAEDVTQEQMVPDVKGTATTPVAIVPPTDTHTRYPNTVVTTIDTHLAVIEDEIPELPTLYDAVVDGAGPVAVTRTLDVGDNVVLSGSLANKLLTFKYKLNGGTGMNCVDVKGYTDLGRLSKDCVKSINGVYAQGGSFTLAAGAGISLLPDQAGHRILVLINASDLTRAAP